VALKRKLYPHFVLPVFDPAIQIAFHRPKSKSPAAVSFELDESWPARINIVASPLFHLDDSPDP
jgi:hypothetical protein